MAWGSDTNNENKPDWKFLKKEDANGRPLLDKVVATEKGWVLRHPWGDEVLVGIGGLDSNLGVASIADVRVISTDPISNTTGQTATVLVAFNEPVAVTGTPTLSLQSSGATPNVALAYVAGSSALETGLVVFSNTAIDASAFVSGTFYTANSSSLLTGWAGIVDSRTSAPVANGIVGTASVAVVPA